jgi:glutamyl/glutaminyl-tRNA synthetase
MTEEEERMDSMMAAMKSAGMSGQMYNRANMQQQLEQMREQAEEDGEYQGVPLKEIDKLREEYVRREADKQAAAGGWQQKLKDLGSSVADKVQQAKSFVTSKLTEQLQKVSSGSKTEL